MSSIIEIDIKNRTYWFFNGMINIKNKYITIENLSYAKIYSVNPLYIIIDKADG